MQTPSWSLFTRLSSNASRYTLY